MRTIIIPIFASNFRGAMAASILGACILTPLGKFGTVLAQPQPNIAGQVGRSEWCVDMTSLTGYLDCSYHTYEQCAATARGISNICLLNSFFVPKAKPRQGQRRDPRR